MSNTESNTCAYGPSSLADDRFVITDPELMKITQKTTLYHGTANPPLRLEKLYWEALDEIASREKVNISRIIYEISQSQPQAPLSLLVRSFCVNYFRRSANNSGT